MSPRLPARPLAVSRELPCSNPFISFSSSAFAISTSSASDFPGSSSSATSSYARARNTWSKCAKRRRESGCDVLKKFRFLFLGVTCTKPPSVLGLVQTKPIASTPSAFCPPFKIISGRLHTKPGERFSRPSCRSSSTHSRAPAWLVAPPRMWSEEVSCGANSTCVILSCSYIAPAQQWSIPVQPHRVAYKADSPLFLFYLHTPRCIHALSSSPHETHLIGWTRCNRPTRTSRLFN